MGKQKTSSRAAKAARRAGFAQPPETMRAPWQVPEKIFCSNILSGSALDFRRARFVYPETTIYANQLLGGFKMWVPPGVQVDVAGLGILGGFRGGAAGYSDMGPVIKVVGVSVLGGAKVYVDESVPALQMVSQ